MKCEVTGVDLVLSNRNFNPYTASIDRIDPSKGYTKDNVRIVCLIYNYCKNRFNEDTVIQFLKKVNLQFQ